MKLSTGSFCLPNKKAIRGLVLLIGFLSSANPSFGAVAQDVSTTTKLGDQNITITLESLDPACKSAGPIQVNKTFCFRVLAKGANDAWLKDFQLLKFDALMPGHHHGMITRPKLRAIKSGEYLIEGVKLHMPGEWTINLNLQHGKAQAQVAIPLKL